MLKDRRTIVISATVLVVGAWIGLSFWVFQAKKSSQLHTDGRSSSVAASQNDTCAESNNLTFSCYKAQLTNVTAKYGPESAVAILKDQYEKNSYVKSQCHQLIHVVGRAALAHYGNVAQTYSHGDQFCWSGYYHGALEQLARDKGLNFLVAQANNICADIPGKAEQSFYYYNCVHGLGHGYMFVESGELFKSLADCDALTDDFDRTSCYGGVFMQNIMNEQAPDIEVDASGQPQKSYLRADQPMYPCTALAEKYKDQCYLMQTSYALQVEKYDFSRGFELCSAIEPAYRDTCYSSLGRDASGTTISDIDKSRTNCLLGKTHEARQYCFRGAAKDFVSYFHSDVQAKQLCQSLPADLSADCLQTVKDYYATF